MGAWVMRQMLKHAGDLVSERAGSLPESHHVDNTDRAHNSPIIPTLRATGGFSAFRNSGVSQNYFGLVVLCLACVLIVSAYAFFSRQSHGKEAVKSSASEDSESGPKTVGRRARIN